MARIIQVASFRADGTQVTREFKQMGDAGQQMSQRVQQGARSIPPAMRAVDASAGVAKQKLDGLASSAGSLGTVLRSLGPMGIAAAAAIGGLTLAAGALQNATRGAVRELGTLYDNAVRMNISTDALQSYRFAMLGIGSAAEGADAALAAFSRAIGQLETETGRRALEALTGEGGLGFELVEIQGRRVEELLPQIADRIAALDSAAAQTAIAQKLGLEPMLPILQQGSKAFDDAARAAKEMGYTIDRELLARASQFNGQWGQASAIIGVQFKSALVDIAPTFIMVATAIAEATRELVGFIDAFKEIERRSNSTLERNFDQAHRAQLRLTRQHGGAIWQGGDADRGEQLLRQWERMPGQSLETATAPGLRSDRDAADMYAALAQRRQSIMRIQEERARAGERPDMPGLPPDSPTAPATPAAADPELARMRAFVDAMREEARVREDLARIMSANDNLSRDEAERIRQQQNDLARLNELRAAGVIRSDEELRQLQAMRIGRDEHAASLKREAELREKINQVMRDAEQRRSNVVAFERAQETPQERIRREIGEAEGMRNQGASDEAVQRRIAALNREYRDLAKAQWDASIAGQALSAAVQGQIRSWDDLGRVMISLLADSAIRALLTGQSNASNGGSFWGGVASAFFGGFGGGGSTGGGSFNAGLIKAAGKAGGGRTQPGARHSVAEQGVEMSVVGGWSHVLPNGTFEALADLARAVQHSQRAPAAPAGAGGRMDVTINNQASDLVDVRAEERARADGMQELSVTLTRKTGADIATGEFDGAMRSRYGARGPRTQRG